MARATASASNVDSSVLAPPPRTTAITSRGRVDRCAIAAATDASAPTPCTRVSAKVTRHPEVDVQVATIDNAHTRYYVVHLHRLLDPAEQQDE